jgi:CTP:molybdopterin cytidylyltransferase MocA
VVFGREVFDDLRQADQSVGLKSVIRAHEAAIINVPIDDPGAFIDIDDPEDYVRFIGPWPFSKSLR